MKVFVKGWFAGLLVGIGITLLFPFFFYKDRKVEPEITIKTDTITFVKTDTVTLYKPKYISEKVIDTLYIEKKDSSLFPIEIKQRYYSEEGLYELWISGVRPSLDKINVWPKTTYRTIRDVEIHKVYGSSWRGYIGGNILTFDGKWVPSLELTFTSPKSLYLKAGVGVFENKPSYSVGAGFRMFGK